MDHSTFWILGSVLPILSILSYHRVSPRFKVNILLFFSTLGTNSQEEEVGLKHYWISRGKNGILYLWFFTALYSTRSYWAAGKYLAHTLDFGKWFVLQWNQDSLKSLWFSVISTFLKTWPGATVSSQKRQKQEFISKLCAWQKEV